MQAFQSIVSQVYIFALGPRLLCSNLVMYHARLLRSLRNKASLKIKEKVNGHP